MRLYAIAVLAAVLALGPSRTEAQGSFGEGGDDLSAPPATGASAERPVPPPPAEADPPPDAIPAPPPEEGEPSYPAPRGEGFPRSAPQTEGVRIPSRIATRLRVLDADLNALASRGGSHVVDGVLSLITGGLSITMGVVVRRRGTTSGDKRLGNYLYLWGTANAVRGVIDLSIYPNASDAAITFGHMPMGSTAEVRERLEYGEHKLRTIAHRTRLARILDASINIGAGLAVIPIYLGPSNFRIEDPLDYFVIIGSGISVISGIINLVSRSEAEKRWSAYDGLRERLTREAQSEDGAGEGLEAEADRPRFQADLGVSPVRGGAAAFVGARF